jgi:hypothetical protein
MKQQPGIDTSVSHESYQSCVRFAPARVHPGHIAAGQGVSVHRGVN